MVKSKNQKDKWSKDVCKSKRKFIKEYRAESKKLNKNIKTMKKIIKDHC